MKKLLIINQSQFGYHSDTYYYCKYLKNCLPDRHIPYLRLYDIRVFYSPKTEFFDVPSPTKSFENDFALAGNSAIIIKKLRGNA
ncbi:MAG: hypothetical protein U9R41_00755 [Candidatus Marinimicrobia bacterium]|nr:hypothetical protein [Candidatus Neomarinimicrobiota bacterium]